MSRLLEILGRGMEIDISELIWQWLGAAGLMTTDIDSARIQRLNHIAELIHQNKEQPAIEQLRMYLFDNPSCVFGRIAAAAVCLDNNQLQRAVEELNSVYMRQPNNTMALYALGHCYERLAKEAEAVEFYQDCLKFKNCLQLPRYRLAAVYFKNQQLEKTIQEYKLLVEEYPNDITTLVMLGYLYITSNNYAEAVDAFNKAILMHPDNLHYENKQVDRLIQNGQIHEALERVNDSLNEQPERVDLMVKHGDILSMLGNTSDAFLEYERALRNCPDFLEATIKLGTQYLQLDQNEAAARQFNRGVEINDRIVDAYIGLAMAQKAAGSKSRALTTLSLAAAIQPNSSVLFSEAANLQFQIGSSSKENSYSKQDPGRLIEATIAAHRQQIKLRPDDPDLHYRFGMLMMSVNRMNDAVKFFKRTMQINPTYHRADNKLAVCLYETGQEKMALERLDHREKLSRETLDLHYKVALLYCNKLKFASSLFNLEQYMQENLAQMDAMVNISIVLQNLGLLDRATAMWDNLSKTVNQAKNTNQPFILPDKF